jgi:hypothetical protein
MFCTFNNIQGQSFDYFDMNITSDSEDNEVQTVRWI